MPFNEINNGTSPPDQQVIASNLPEVAASSVAHSTSEPQENNLKNIGSYQPFEDDVDSSANKRAWLNAHCADPNDPAEIRELLNSGFVSWAGIPDAMKFNSEVIQFSLQNEKHLSHIKRLFTSRHESIEDEQKNESEKNQYKQRFNFKKSLRKKIIMEASMLNDGMFLPHFSAFLLNNKAILLEALEQNPAAVPHAPAELINNKEFISNAMKNNYEIVHSLPDRMQAYALQLYGFNQLRNQLPEGDHKIAYLDEFLKQMESPSIPLNNTIHLMELTAQMLQGEIANQSYQEYARSLQHHASSTLRTVGKIMMALGTLVTLAGIAAVAFVAPTVSIPVLAGGALTCATGFGFFCKRGTENPNMPAQYQDDAMQMNPWVLEP